MDRWTDGLTEGRNEGRTDGRTYHEVIYGKNLNFYRLREAQTGGQTDRRTCGWTDIWMDGRVVMKTNKNGQRGPPKAMG